MVVLVSFLNQSLISGQEVSYSTRGTSVNGANGADLRNTHRWCRTLDVHGVDLRTESPPVHTGRPYPEGVHTSLEGQRAGGETLCTTPLVHCSPLRRGRVLLSWVDRSLLLWTGHTPLWTGLTSLWAGHTSPVGGSYLLWRIVPPCESVAPPL